MKHIYILALTSLFAFGLGAQVNSKIKIFSKKTHAEITGQVYNIIGDGARPLVKEEFKTVMVSQDSLLVGIKRTELNIINGTSDYFCWYVCYTAKTAGSLPVWKALDSLWMYENDTITNFSVYLEPSGTTGTACYRYVFYPEDAPADSSFIDVCFDLATVGVNEMEKNKIKMFPNPASEQLNVDMSKSDYKEVYLKISDLNGRLMEEYKLTRGTNILSAEKLSPGTYIVQIFSEDQKLLKQERIIIQ